MITVDPAVDPAALSDEAVLLLDSDPLLDEYDTWCQWYVAASARLGLQPVGAI